MKTRQLNLPAALLLATASLLSVATGTYAAEPPSLAAKVDSGELPVMAQRLPENPLVVELDGNKKPGEYGGEMRLLMGKAKDIRQMTIYGYARLIGYTKEQTLAADILESFEVSEGRQFTFVIRKDHKWSDGEPFTAEAFRYFWEDIILDPDLSEGRLSSVLKVNDQLPEFEILDPQTVRYTWEEANPYFLPAIAGPSPLYLYKPGHYLKSFHKKYAGEEAMTAMVAKKQKRNWMSIHHGKDKPYKQTNPDLPTLQPWRNKTAMPADRFVFERNPYFHRVDNAGKQLPYIDQVVIGIASNKLIAAKTGAGEADLQARYIRLDNYPYLKKGEKKHPYNVRLWATAKGSQLALYPNMNTRDEQWRRLMQDARFRRALSMGINRQQINKVVYYGLAKPGNNTVISESPLFKQEYADTWAGFDIDAANALLDEIGLDKIDKRGIRLLPNGKPLEIPIQTAGESTEQTDVLELIHDTWMKIGVKLFSVPSQREVFRSRVFAGEAIMAIWNGLENGMPTADSIPEWLTPTSKYQYQWPQWGEWVATNGAGGQQPEQPEVLELIDLHEQWRLAGSTAEREEIWHKILALHAEQTFTIGILNGVKQPVVINKHLNNVPEEGIYDISATAYFGVYNPDTFWFSRERQ